MKQALSLDDRGDLARLVIDIMQEWQLSPEQQLNLLGMPEDCRPRELVRLKNGSPLPEDELILDRARHILGIQHSLHIVFPMNQNMPKFWLKNKNRFLKGVPLYIMMGEGLDGMHRVWRHLDCTLNWE